MVASSRRSRFIACAATALAAAMHPLALLAQEGESLLGDGTSEADFTRLRTAELNLRQLEHVTRE